MIYLIPTDTCFGIACAISDLEGYKKIYEIKKRELNKPLSIMVSDFLWLKNNTNLTSSQIIFLKEYKKPFTILTSTIVFFPFLLKGERARDRGIFNKEAYSKIAFRVVHNDFQKKLVKKIGPIFLTSANFSGEKEIYKIEDLKNNFKKYINEKSINLNYVGENDLNSNIKPSDIFEFVGDSLEIKYLRN